LGQADNRVFSKIDQSLASLRTKRCRIHAQLRKLEPLLADYHAKLAEVNTVIHEIDPQLWMQSRTYQRNAIFARGEVPRLALAVMREAGEPLPIAVIVRKMLAAKGVDLPDRRTFKLTKNRLHNLCWRSTRGASP
jgi:hypothetical protein